LRGNFVDAEYFSALRIPLLQGRLWDKSENDRGASRSPSSIKVSPGNTFPLATPSVTRFGHPISDQERRRK